MTAKREQGATSLGMLETDGEIMAGGSNQCRGEKTTGGDWTGMRAQRIG